MLATRDSLAIALYVHIDDFLRARPGPGGPPRITRERGAVLVRIRLSRRV